MKTIFKARKTVTFGKRIATIKPQPLSDFTKALNAQIERRERLNRIYGR